MATGIIILGAICVAGLFGKLQGRKDFFYKDKWYET